MKHSELNDSEADVQEEPKGVGLSSMLREIVALSPKKGRAAFLEDRARHAYESVIKLFDLIREEYPGEEGVDIRRRFVNSVRARDFKKVSRGIKKLGAKTDS